MKGGRVEKSENRRVKTVRVEMPKNNRVKRGKSIVKWKNQKIV